MESSAPKLGVIGAVAVFLTLLLAACGSNGAGNGAQTATALQSYRSYVEQKSAELVQKTKLLVFPIRAGKLHRAQSFYVIARVPYGQIVPIAGLLGSLDSRINAQIDAGEGEFGGFHRIEKGLWAEGTTGGIAPIAKRLLADVETLQRKIRMLTPKPAQIARAAASTLEGISASAILGKEQRYSEADLVDVAASVEGVGKAYESVDPLVIAKDPELARQIGAEFAGLYESLGEYGTLARDPYQRRPNAPGVGFYEYSSLSQSDIHRLERKMAQASEALSQVPTIIIQD